jgi:hypothetical protein
MESRFGGSRLDCAEMSVQTPMRGSGTPGWTAASSPNNSKIRIGPPQPMGRVYQIYIATYRSPAQVYTRVTKREHTNGFRGRSTSSCLCGSSVPPQSFPDADLL